MFRLDASLKTIKVVFFTFISELVLICSSVRWTLGGRSRSDAERIGSLEPERRLIG